MAEAKERKFIINFGPQHPAAHGVLVYSGIECSLNINEGCSGRNSRRAAREGRPWPAFAGRGSATTFKFSSASPSRPFGNITWTAHTALGARARPGLSRACQWVLLLDRKGPVAKIQVYESPGIR